jgi:hypothetical protein
VLVRLLTIAFGVMMAALAVCSARAETRNETCAAELWYQLVPPLTDDGRSAQLVFSLTAPSSRTIDSATIVADTDAGWFTWNVTDVQLTMLRYAAFSMPSVVTFDKKVLVRHAWLTQAQAKSCPIPPFEGLVAPHPSPSPSAAMPPTQGLPGVVPNPIPAPYTTDCMRPFGPAAVVHAVQPVYPRGLGPGHYYAEIFVAVGDQNNLVDSWIYKSSGNDAIDASALKAARASTYQSAISYCHNAPADYIFRADFAP